MDFRDTPHVHSGPQAVHVTELSLFVPYRNVDLLARLGGLLCWCDFTVGFPAIGQKSIVFSCGINPD